MEAMGKIGECFWIGSCLVMVFLFLSLMTSLKLGVLLRITIPIFGFLIVMCMGIYLGSLISPTVARIAAIPSGLIGLVIGFSITNKS